MGKVTKKNKPLVSVCCITYNHEIYIGEAIKGFLMQKTSFPIEIIIHDDASTDKTQQIIKEFALKDKRIVPILRKNNIKKSTNKPIFPLTFKRAKGTYIALCEGDDCWIDPYKLQVQVDYMEKHPNCSLCFHAAKMFERNKSTNRIIRAETGNTTIESNKFFYCFGTIAPTTTLLFRAKHVKNLPEWFYKSPVGDVPLKLIFLTKGDFYYNNRVMAVRRTNVVGSWNDLINSDKNLAVKHARNMIHTLSRFNIFSGYKYQEEVLLKQYNYEKKVLKFETLSERFIFLKKYKTFIQKKKLKKRIFIYLLCYSPKLHKLISFIISRVKLNGKK